MRIRQGIVLAVVGAALTGCNTAPEASAPLDFAFFNNEQSPADQLPENGIGVHPVPVDSVSSRLLANRDGVHFYAARMSENPEQSVCLFAYTEDGQSTGSCGGFAEDGTEGPNALGFGIEAQILRDGTDSAALEASGWTVAHPNLVVRARQGVRPK